MSLKGKHALVTGSSRGIGRGIALKLAVKPQTPQDALLTTGSGHPTSSRSLSVMALVTAATGYVSFAWGKFWTIIDKMEPIHLGDQIIRYDGRRTRTAYAAMKLGSPERCGCPYCRNFVAQRSSIYPEKFRLVLDQLGIDPEKEGDVFELGPEGPLVLYNGWFYLAGELIEAGEQMTEAGPNLQYFFRASHRPKALADFGEEVLALEFSTKLPWVLSEQPEWV